MQTQNSAALIDRKSSTITVSKGADCYLRLFAYTTLMYVVAVMVQWPIVAKLIVAKDLNRDLLRMVRVGVAMLGFWKSQHTFPL